MDLTLTIFFIVFILGVIVGFMISYFLLFLDK